MKLLTTASALTAAFVSLLASPMLTVAAMPSSHASAVDVDQARPIADTLNTGAKLLRRANTDSLQILDSNTVVLKGKLMKKLLHNKTPSAGDRANTKRLRCPSPVPLSFLRHLGVTDDHVTEIRKREAEGCEFMDYVNEYFPKYVSPCALLNVDGGEYHPMTEDEVNMLKAKYDTFVSGYQDYVTAFGEATAPAEPITPVGP